MQCGLCGSLDLELLAGEELLVEALELADDREALALADDGGPPRRADESTLEEQLITSN
jgi:hypothetical protein